MKKEIIYYEMLDHAIFCLSCGALSQMLVVVQLYN